MPASHLRVENRSAGAGPEWDCSVMRPDDTGRVRAGDMPDPGAFVVLRSAGFAR